MKFSIKTLSFRAVLIFALVALGTMLGLLLAATAQSRSLKVAAHSTAAAAQTAELERSLLAYQRLANLSLFVQEPELLPEEMRLWSEVLRQLDALEERFSGSADAPHVQQIAAAVTLYYQDRAALAARAEAPGRVVQLTRLTLNRALDRIELLRRQKEAETATEQALARLWSWLVIGCGLAISVLLLFGLAGAIYGVRRHILLPVLQLSDAMQRFLQGDRLARADSYAALEADAIAHTFNEMAESIERQRQMRRAFMAGVAHDLRNPLMTLSTGLQLLRQDLPAEQEADLYARLERQLERLKRMAGDLLDSAHIEVGTLDLQRQELELGRLAREVVDLFALRISTHRLIFPEGGEPLWVSADPSRLEQVLENLLSNAVKYSPAGTPIEITTRASGEDAVLCVADSGLGIHPDEHEEIFMPFYRRASTRTTTSGTGIGLSLVKAIVQAHGGKVQVTSSPGSGSTFCLCLPMVRRGAALPHERLNEAAELEAQPAPTRVDPGEP